MFARLSEHEKSISTLLEAMRTAESAGAVDSAGHAALTHVEGHAGTRLSVDEADETHRRARVARTQDAEDLARLRACARAVTGLFRGVELPEGFSLPHAVRDYEARFIRQALHEEDGSVSRASARLGATHQSLAHMLGARESAVPRRRSIIRIWEA